jgi:hypothetical protein
MRSLCLVLALVTTVAGAQDNPAIDMPAHLRVAAEAAEHRATRRISQAQFIRMSREPGTAILDAAKVYELGPTIDPRRSQLEFEPC